MTQESEPPAENATSQGANSDPERQTVAVDHLTTDDLTSDDGATERLDSDPAHRSSPRPTWVQRLKGTDRVQVLIVVLIGLMLVVFLRGVSLGVTGEDRYTLGKHIESVQPIPDATQVNATSAIQVDLDTGYTGVLIIDDVEIPTTSLEDFRVQKGQQIEIPPTTIYDPGNATLTFTPSDDALISSLQPGLHQATVRYWKLTDGEARTRTYRWSFYAI